MGVDEATLMTVVVGFGYQGKGCAGVKVSRPRLRPASHISTLVQGTDKRPRCGFPRGTPSIKLPLHSPPTYHNVLQHVPHRRRQQRHRTCDPRTQSRRLPHPTRRRLLVTGMGGLLARQQLPTHRHYILRSTTTGADTG